MVGVVLAALTVAGAIELNGQNVGAVRPEADDLRALFARGVERSATFRDLVARLNASDIVVYVRFSRCSGSVPTCLLWAEPGQGVRRVVIKVNRSGLSEDSLVALLGHELQHAWEVASDASIKDAASFAKAFQQRGWKGADTFETREAQEVGRQVRKELFDYQATIGDRRQL